MSFKNGPLTVHALNLVCTCWKKYAGRKRLNVTVLFDYVLRSAFLVLFLFFLLPATALTQWGQNILKTKFEYICHCSFTRFLPCNVKKDWKAFQNHRLLNKWQIWQMSGNLTSDNYMITWQQLAALGLPRNCLTTAWRIPGNCLMTAWKLPEDCQMSAWQWTTTA